MTTERKKIRADALKVAEDGTVVVDDPAFYEAVKATEKPSLAFVQDEEGGIIEIEINAGCVG